MEQPIVKKEYIYLYINIYISFHLERNVRADFRKFTCDCAILRWADLLKQLVTMEINISANANTTPHCLVHSEGNVNFSGTRSPTSNHYIYGAIYGPLLVLHHTGWSTQKGMLTFQWLGALEVWLSPYWSTVIRVCPAISSPISVFVYCHTTVDIPLIRSPAKYRYGHSDE